MLDTGRRDTTRDALRRFGRAAAEIRARLALHGVDAIGARPHVRGAPFVQNLGRITVGDDLDLSSEPVRSHLVTGVHGAIEIGSGVRIGEGAAISALDRITIGDGARLGAFVMLLDADHHTARDRGAPGKTEPIVIGARARIGDRVTVLRGARIGDRARVESDSVVWGTVEEGAIVAGIPACPIPRASEIRERAAAADLEGRVQRVAQRVFALPEIPAPNLGPGAIPGWDSLGALRLLVSIEGDLGVSLPREALAGVRDLGALARVVADHMKRQP